MKEIKLTPKRKEALQQLGLNSSEDILNYFPYRYQKLEYLDYEDWQIDSKVVFEGILVGKPTVSRFGRNRSLITLPIETEFNVFKVAVFNQIWFRNREPGTRFTVVGKYEGNNRVLASSVTTTPMKEMLGITPVYSLKDLIKPKNYAETVRKVLEANQGEIEDFIPEVLKDKYGLYSRYDALREVHFPTHEKRLAKALNTLKYEQFLRFQLYMLYRKGLAHVRDESLRKDIDRDKITEFIKGLPFELTADQQQAIKEILDDMSSDYQMFRLLQGDVGCGKTVVAMCAMYGAHLAGWQSCLMAPTEILARQHYQNIVRIFSDYDIGIDVLYSSQSARERKEILERIASGKTAMIIGTHALFQNDVTFNRLGLIITDEQQRFGVKQRQALQKKGDKADLLLMSATPIPRTLASSLYGDMDVTTISQSPNRGKTIHTKVIKKNSFLPVIKEIEKLLAEGNQMYVICPAIENGEETVTRNVTDIHRNLSAYFKGRYHVGLLHGQMDDEEKSAVQDAFARGEIDILVATTVVEVGVDVKNANIMVIYDANRFGLSQLHQLRGRVGRGEKEGYCYLLTDSQEKEALERLEVIEKNTDGFKISYYDLKLRGPGDILGTRQSGLPVFAIGNIVDDAEILNICRSDASEILNNIDDPQYERIRNFLQDSSQEEVFLD
ncbi:MAG: ATP-dependent DNA helicase RecG [Erysipelotrichaceae bacterium]|nr:ATP-dependent DNA helicase RecG [Erysipelotrichaceae bacterium]